MAVLIAPSDPLGLLVAVANPTTRAIFDPKLPVKVPSGALRIGGDSPSGLVLVGDAPAARVVDLFDRESRAFVATTTSASDGTYSFTGLADRSEGYDVIIRGVIASNERDAIVPGMHPG